MATRVLGPTGSRRRRRFLFVSLLLVACTALFLAGSAQAVHDLAFQLDGETTSTAYSPPPNSNPAFDWNDIFNVTNNAPVPPATDGTQTVSVNSNNVGSGKTFDAASFTRDFETNATCPTTSDIGLKSLSTNFCTGDDTTYATGSKDTLGIGNGGWQCNHDNNVNSKIDIMNAYVLQYTNPTADADGVHHKIFYFGVERNVSNGTNDVGVWFLQSGASCTSPVGSTNFTGGHLDGDTLVVAEQTSGGGVSTAKAFRWAASTDPTSKFFGDGGCIDSNDNFDPAVVVNGTKGCNNLPIASGGDCKTASGGDSICGTTNAFCELPHGKPPATTPPCTLPWNQNVTTKWRTANSSSVDETIVPPDFFEGGIDITQAFKGHAGNTPSCFNTVAPDTRSSASPTATLFDFTLNQLGGCTQALTTQENAAASRQIGTNGTITSGTDTANLKITGTANWGGTLTWYLCGPDVSSCDTSGYQVTSQTVANTDNSNCGADCTYTSGSVNVTSAGAVGATSRGQYCWHAQFVPDAATAAAGVKKADDNGLNECFTITPRTPTLTTSASCSATPCLLGSTLNDSAVLSGTANNPDPANPGTNSTYPTIGGGTKAADSSITWTLHGPGTGGVADCSASTLIANAPTPSSIAVTGDNTYGPVSYVTNHAGDTVGKYEFAASYPGEGPNTNAASGVSCDTTGQNNEQVTVTGSASSSSKQGWLPNDRITLSSTAGTTLNGNLTVTLYYGALAAGASLSNCSLASGAVQEFQETWSSAVGADHPPISGNPVTVNTHNASFFVGTNPSTGAAGGPDTDASHSYIWLIHYADNSLTSPNDRCETSTITHNDG